MTDCDLCICHVAVYNNYSGCHVCVHVAMVPGVVGSDVVMGGAVSVEAAVVDPAVVVVGIVVVVGGANVVTVSPAFVHIVVGDACMNGLAN